MLDSTRPTAMAHAFMLNIDSELVKLPDISSYNLYYGWYLGELVENDNFFDEFRAKFPDAIIGLSEYGADGNPDLHTPRPERGDYSEEYQAIYHEHMVKMIAGRPYLWATHIWNMFDFAADGRDEGGKHGLNQKGLVSFDRKVKKDAFYVYAAYWSKHQFVHVCGRRYVDRIEEFTQIKVYSNCPKVTLFIDNSFFEEKIGSKIFNFNVPISGCHMIRAEYENHSDCIKIQKVDIPNPNYSLPQSCIINWFDKDDAKEGYFNIKNTLGEISAVPEGAELIAKLMSAARARRGDVTQGVTRSAAMQKAINSTSLEKILQVGDSLDKEFLVEIVRNVHNIKMTEEE